MNNNDGNISVPTDVELLQWGWTANHISQLRTLPASSQLLVFEEYVRRMMEGRDIDGVDF